MEHIRHLMAKKSDVDCPEDIEHVLQHCKDPPAMNSLDDPQGKACAAEILKWKNERDRLRGIKKEDRGQDHDDEVNAAEVSFHQAKSLSDQWNKTLVSRIEKRKTALNKNKRSAATILHERCETTLQEKLREKQNWKDVDDMEGSSGGCSVQCVSVWKPLFGEGHQAASSDG